MKRRRVPKLKLPAHRQQLVGLAVGYGLLPFILAWATLPLVSGQHLTQTTVNRAAPGRTASLSLRYLDTTQTLAAAHSQTALDLRLDTGGGNVTGFQITLLYDPNLVEVTDLTPGSVCSVIQKRSISPDTGKITLNCTTATPGLTTQLSSVATLAIVPLTAATSPTFLFDRTATTVAAHTAPDILRQAAPFTLAVAGSGALVDGVVENHTTPASGPLTYVPVASPTQPDQGRCYPSLTTTLTWPQPAAAASFRYSWTSDLQASTLSETTTSTSLQLPVKPGTTTFFHLQPVDQNGNLGPMSTYRVTQCS